MGRPFPHVGASAPSELFIFSILFVKILHFTHFTPQKIDYHYITPEKLYPFIYVPTIKQSIGSVTAPNHPLPRKVVTSSRDSFIRLLKCKF